VFRTPETALERARARREEVKAGADKPLGSSESHA
jgi:hypothetical protein